MSSCNRSGRPAIKDSSGDDIELLKLENEYLKNWWPPTRAAHRASEYSHSIDDEIEYPPEWSHSRISVQDSAGTNLGHGKSAR